MNGRTLYEKYDDKGRRLIWEPVFATISRSEELGVTTGPWELKKSATDRDSMAFGQFVSVWKRQPDNTWKVILDVGTIIPRRSAADQSPAYPRRSNPDLIRICHDRSWTAPNKISEALKAMPSCDPAAADNASDFSPRLIPAVVSAAKLMLNSDHTRTTRIFGGTTICRAISPIATAPAHERET
jgi:hypothetical protein